MVLMVKMGSLGQGVPPAPQALLELMAKMEKRVLEAKMANQEKLGHRDLQDRTGEWVKLVRKENRVLLVKQALLAQQELKVPRELVVTLENGEKQDNLVLMVHLALGASLAQLVSQA